MGPLRGHDAALFIDLLLLLSHHPTDSFLLFRVETRYWCGCFEPRILAKPATKWCHGQTFTVFSFFQRKQSDFVCPPAFPLLPTHFLWNTHTCTCTHTHRHKHGHQLLHALCISASDKMKASLRQKISCLHAGCARHLWLTRVRHNCESH